SRRRKFALDISSLILAQKTIRSHSPSGRPRWFANTTRRPQNSSPQRRISMINALYFVCHRPSTVLASSARTSTVLAETENEPTMQANGKDFVRFGIVEFRTHLMELISDRAKLAHATKSLFCLCLIVGAIALAAEIGATALAESFGLLQLPYAL